MARVATVLGVQGDPRQERLRADLTYLIRSLKARGEIVGCLIDKRFQRFRGNVAQFTRAPGQAGNHADPSLIYCCISGIYDLFLTLTRTPCGDFDIGCRPLLGCRILQVLRVSHARTLTGISHPFIKQEENVERDRDGPLPDISHWETEMHPSGR
jgi:hypothetical protein